MIRCHTYIANGSPNKQDRAAAHGATLGEEEVRLTKEQIGWPLEPTFPVPQQVYDYFEGRRVAWAKEETKWQRLFSEYSAVHPDLTDLWRQVISGQLPEVWTDHLPEFEAGRQIATRSASGKVLNAIAAHLPTLIGGWADLAPSNKTYLASYGPISKSDFRAHKLHFGVGEHAMGGILNGLALRGGLIPYGGTFLVFCDHMRPSIRLAAMMRLPVIYVLSHDSFFIGEDGPTHQPLEQLATLRAIPGLVVIIPADANETAVAWEGGLGEKRPGGAVAHETKISGTRFLQFRGRGGSGSGRPYPKG